MHQAASVLAIFTVSVGIASMVLACVALLLTGWWLVLVWAQALLARSKTFARFTASIIEDDRKRRLQALKELRGGE